jgi:hypothetical protein
MSEIHNILKDFEKRKKAEGDYLYLNFSDFLERLRSRPERILRDIFQLVHDMVHFYVPPGVDEMPEDEESVHFMNYDFHRLLIKGSDAPYFADRLFANRFMALIDSFGRVPDWHKIYLIEGPPGSGKSTFLKNFLYRFQRYMTVEEEGEYYETVWEIDTGLFPDFNQDLESADIADGIYFKNQTHILVPCPHHDNPILQIPKEFRKELLYEIIADEEFKEKLYTEKRYKWIFKAEPCTICLSLYEALLDKIQSPMKVLEMLKPRQYRVNRRLGEGISVYNPGDLYKKKVNSNPMLQRRLNVLFGDSNKVKYSFSDLARTNNGIYVVMDVKSQNQERIQSLHGVVSDGIHKVESIEENIKSLFIALINPQDKEQINKTKSLQDRSVYIQMPYVLDYKTEIAIYKNNFGAKIGEDFLPGVLNNFAKVIVSTRLSQESPGLANWIKNPKKYSQYCDEQMQLLKLDLYTGHIPDWLEEDDLRSFKAEVRRNILSEAESEGTSGITGRESIYVFNSFYSQYSKRDRMINMQMVYDFFLALSKEDEDETISREFLDSLIQSYDYTALQQIKECMYTYNKQMISENIQDYIFALNFDYGSAEKNPLTGKVIEVTEEFFRSFEDVLLGKRTPVMEREAFRKDVQQKYVSQTSREVQVEKKRFTQTSLYRELQMKYLRALKQHVLDPFLINDQFRNAIKEYKTKEFKSYDKKIKKDVTFLLRRLQQKYDYSEAGAKEVCIYIMDKNIEA